MSTLDMRLCPVYGGFCDCPHYDEEAGICTQDGCKDDDGIWCNITMIIDKKGNRYTIEEWREMGKVLK